MFQNHRRQTFFKNRKTQHQKQLEAIGRYSMFSHLLYEMPLDPKGRDVFLYVTAQSEDWGISIKQISRRLRLDHRTVENRIAQLRALRMIRKCRTADGEVYYVTVPPLRWLAPDTRAVEKFHQAAAAKGVVAYPRRGGCATTPPRAPNHPSNTRPKIEIQIAGIEGRKAAERGLSRRCDSASQSRMTDKEKVLHAIFQPVPYGPGAAVSPAECEETRARRAEMDAAPKPTLKSVRSYVAGVLEMTGGQHPDREARLDAEERKSA